MVKGTLNGFAFQDALEPDGNSGHWLHIDKQLQKAANIRIGNEIEVEIEATKDWPEPHIPADIKTGISADPEVFALWSDTTPMARWEWIRWINSTTNPDTRKKRIEVSCDKLLKGNRRPCCFNRNMCCVPQVSKSGILLGVAVASGKRTAY